MLIEQQEEIKQRSYADKKLCAHRGRAGDKAGFWKCPYHNSRMCLEII